MKSLEKLLEDLKTFKKGLAERLTNVVLSSLSKDEATDEKREEIMKNISEALSILGGEELKFPDMKDTFIYEEGEEVNDEYVNELDGDVVIEGLMTIDEDQYKFMTHEEVASIMVKSNDDVCLFPGDHALTFRKTKDGYMTSLVKNSHDASVRLVPADTLTVDTLTRLNTMRLIKDLLDSTVDDNWYEKRKAAVARVKEAREQLIINHHGNGKYLSMAKASNDHMVITGLVFDKAYLEEPLDLKMVESLTDCFDDTISFNNNPEDNFKIINWHERIDGNLNTQILLSDDRDESYQVHLVRYTEEELKALPLTLDFEKYKLFQYLTEEMLHEPCEIHEPTLKRVPEGYTKAQFLIDLAKAMGDSNYRNFFKAFEGCENPSEVSEIDDF